MLRATDSIGQQLCLHAERVRGRSSYTIRHLLRLWLNVFTIFSILPLRIASVLGLAMSGAGALLAIYFTISWSVGGIVRQGVIPPGWASLIVSVTLFSGLQLCVLGMIGEYLGRLYQAQSRKPQFVVRERRGLQDADE